MLGIYPHATRASAKVGSLESKNCSINVPMTDSASDDSDEALVKTGISPSAFMRKLRPEYYSDTKPDTSSTLSASALEYHLESITSRNQTHEFEVFCRKLCERTICPNLRPQTGPDGGGDSKADTETYAVADEIAGLYYIGEANSGRERWGFGFSAKASWADKVRNDVKGMVETGRTYDRIICVTSRFAKAKSRASLEDELTKKYGVPVTIHDRSWIVTEVVENNRTDLAVNYLKIGESATKSARLGPADYSRAQQLEDTERSIQDPESFRGMETQRVTEALVAAKLSRGLERPRIETDGRFTRAIRLADSDGTYRQKLEARYEEIWTAFWWYDDFVLLNASYDDFEARALKSDHTKNLEFLGNLNQLLVNCVVHGHMTAEECRLVQRTENLKQALETIAGYADQPNNSLEASAALMRIRLNKAMFAGDRKDISAIWKDLAGILDKAGGLGEFDADGLAAFIELVGGFAGNDPAYNELVEKLAEFVGSRKSEGEGAVILLRRAQKLDFADNFDMIRWLGRAAIGLTKREYADELIEALQLLTLAYRSAGLLWAARATGIFAAASIFIQGEKDSDVEVSIVPTVKHWAWIALELSHLPDVLSAIQLTNGFLAALPLDDASKTRVRDDLRMFDSGLGCLFLNLGEAELGRLERVPDILGALGLFMARMALLYALGHPQVLREDGLPPEETDEDVQRLLSLLKSQPIAESFRGPLVLNSNGRQLFATTILGMRVEVEIDGEDSIILAELILGSLEAFFATILGERVMPHTESFRIVVNQADGALEPVIETNELDMTAIIAWPGSLSVTQFDRQEEMRSFLVEVAARVMGTTCGMRDFKALVERLFENEAVLHRVAMIVAAPNSYTRLASRGFGRLSDWDKVVARSYPLNSTRVDLPRVPLPGNNSPEADNDDGREDVFDFRNHREIGISSVIDVPAWDQAQWRGCGYIQPGLAHPPFMALLFENASAAKKIFQRWRTRFGEADANEEIAIAIIRNLPESDPYHYCVQVSSKDPVSGGKTPKGPLMMATRSMTMEPPNSNNLEMFLAGFKQFGAYFLIPATLQDGKSEFFFDLAILKRSVTVKAADDIDEHDVEALALRIRGLKFA